MDVAKKFFSYLKMEYIKKSEFVLAAIDSGKIVKAQDVLNKIHFTTDDEALREAGFIIENVTERWNIKKSVYARPDSLSPVDCIIASNTSAISITRLASATKRRARVTGIHFMNPVPLKTMVEVIRGFHTSEEKLERAKALLTRRGKQDLIVNNMPEFFSNRVLN